MESTLYLAHYALTRLADYMTNYANKNYLKVTFAVDLCTWFSTDHLKLPMTLSWKLTSCFVGPFKII